MRMVHRLHYRLIAAVLGLTLGATLIDARADEFVGPPVPGRISFEDPFPIRRVLLPSNRLAAELERAKQGILVRLTRTDFENRVRKAALGLRERSDPPLLVEARYRAKLLRDGLDDNALSGTAEWKIFHGGTGLALMPLDSLDIALKNARWIDNRPALIGKLEPRPQAGLSLLVDGSGQHSLALEWTSRGLAEPGELRFDLAVPVSPLASLELELPIGLTPILTHEEAMLSGPFAIDGSERHQNWRIAFGGLGHLEISLRSATSTGGPQPPIQSATSTRQEVSPGLVLSQSTFEFKVLRGDVSELIIEHDPDLTVSDVEVNNLEGWRALPGTTGGRKRISIRLREPARGGQIRIVATSVVPFNQATFWTSPAMQIAGAIPRGESIRLRVAPDLRMVEWSNGSFRFLKSEFAADGSQLLSLESTLLPENQANPVRPSARFRLPATEFRVQQQTEWEIAADHQSLTSRIKASIQHGTLSQLSVRLPAGWDIDRVEGMVREQHLSWTVSQGLNPVLQIELPRELNQGMEGSVLVRLRRTNLKMARGARQPIPYPDVAPLGISGRNGIFIVRVSPAFLASVPPPDEESDFVGPLIPEPSDGRAIWTYRFHGQPPVGPLHLAERKPRLAVSCDSVVSLDSDRPTVTTRLMLKPESGALSSIILMTTEPVTEPWTWHTVQGTNQVLSVRPILATDALAVFGSMASRSPFEIAMHFQLSSKSRWWRMTFARPLETPLTIESVYGAALPDIAVHEQRLRAMAIIAPRPALAIIGAFAAELGRWPVPRDRQSVPLLQIAGPNSQTGTVTVQSATASRRRVETSGMTRDRVRESSTFRQEVYRQSDKFMSMIMLPKESSDTPSASRIDSADLVTAADRSGTWRCLFRFRIQAGEAESLPLKLPVGAKVQEITVGERTLPSELFRIEERDSRIVCTIPLSTGPAWQRIEILYTVPAASFALSAHWKAPAPELPVSPESLRTIWRLPPGIMPLSSDNLARLPGGPMRRNRLHLPWLHEISDGTTSEMRERSFGGAVGPRAAISKDPNVRTIAQALISSGSSGEKPLLDREALAEMDLQPSTLLPAGPDRRWESLGLIVVSYGEGTVLTTPRQQSLWRVDGSMRGSFDSTIHNSLQEAARLGSDASGRFVTVADWLETPPFDHSSLLAQLGGDDSGWSAWEVRETSESFRLAVVNTEHFAIVGWLLAGLLAAAGVLAVGRLGRAGVFLLLFWLLTAAGALIWLPPALGDFAVGPMLAALLIAIISACRRKTRKKEDPAVVTRRSTIQRASLAATTPVMVLLIALALTAQGDAPEPATIYLVPASASEAEPHAILAPPELIERLELLSRPRLALSESTYLRARYVGRSEAAGVAEFEATFNIFTFVDTVTIAVPLGDVRFREVLLDGAAAFPKTSGTERCAIDVKGKGEHMLTVKFAAPIVGSGPDREVLFASPEAAICQLEFAASQGAQHVRAVNWRGAQQVSDDGKQLQADLGRSRTVQVRWRQAGAIGMAAVQMQEASVWDIDGSTATLFSVFDFRIAQGSITALKIALPANLEISRLEVRPETVVPGAPPTWIRNWSIGPNRVLQVDLQGALSGNVRLLLECIPIKSLAARPLLQFPTAVEVNDSEAFVAYRLRGLEATGELERKGVTDFSAESFSKDVWRSAGAEKSPLAVTKAFRRIKNETVSLRPNIRALSSANRGSQELIWWVGDRGADVRATARWGSATEPLTFVEWEVPATVIVNDVRGVNLHSWLRAGNQVQAWLHEPAAEVALIWQGSISRGVAPVETILFDLPAVRLHGVATQTTILRLRSPDGWTLSPENQANLGTPIATRTDREIAGELLEPKSPGRWQLRGPQSDGAFRLLSIASVADQRLGFVTYIDPLLRRDRPHSFSLSLRDSEGWEIDWQLPPGCKLLSRPALFGARNWVIDVAPRESEGLSLQLYLRRSLAAKREQTLPEISIQQGEQRTSVIQRMILLGSELREHEMIGWGRANEPIEFVLQSWPRERDRLKERGGSVWLADGNEAHARILAGPSPLGSAPPVRIILADIEAAPSGDRWRYRARFDLQHDAGAELVCLLPSGARLEGLALDGEMQPIIGDRRITIALPAERGARLLQIAWSSADPRWEAPVFESAEHRLISDLTLWTARARNGERIEAEHPLTLAAIDLRRADALLKMATSLGMPRVSEETSTRLAARASRWIRLADAGLNGPRNDTRNAETAPDGTALTDWSARLREQANALRTPRVRTDGPSTPPIREATLNQFPAADAFGRGLPIHWIASAETTGTDVKIRTASSWSPLPAVASFLSIALAVGLLGALMLLLGRSTRSEQAAFVGVIGAIAFGVPEGAVFLGLTVIALLVRFGWLSVRAVRWLGG